MTSYDLTKLNPREFEALSADILSELEQCRVERFKEGNFIVKLIPVSSNSKKSTSI